MLQQGQQPAVDISEGKVVDASTVTFKRTVTGRGGEITIDYTGKISGSEMTLTPEFPGGGGRGGGGGGRGPVTDYVEAGLVGGAAHHRFTAVVPELCGSGGFSLFCPRTSGGWFRAVVLGSAQLLGAVLERER